MFSGLNGKTLEVFFEDKQQVYYAGTYTCDYIRDRNPQGCLQCPEEVQSAPYIDVIKSSRSHNSGYLGARTRNHKCPSFRCGFKIKVRHTDSA